MTSYDSFKCDVLCIGGGGAAVAAAVSATNNGADVIIVSKEPLGYGDTRISMGMIANPGMVENDTPEKFFQDLLRCGEYINDPELAQIMAEKAGRAREMLEEFGHLFQRDNEGNISPAVAFFSGGHSLPRTLSSPPSNGIGIGNALRAAVAKSKVKVFEETTAYKLISDNGRATGAVCFDIVHGKVMIIMAKTVIIATGGAGWLYYPHTDCTAGATGDGYSLAYNVGAELKDMEQVQFVPFALTHPTSMCGIFIGDPIMAAPYGVLRDKNGEIILDNMKNMARAEVARIMTVHLEKGDGTEHGGLLLDLSPNLATEQGKQLWERRNKLGQLDGVRIAYGEKAYRWEESWDVAPTAHYNMGGIKVDRFARSNVPGLYAVGQAMGGIFGADRLGSVSLAEIFVFGEIAGAAAALEARETSFSVTSEADLIADELTCLLGSSGKTPPEQLRQRLQTIMWKKVGIARDEDGLTLALDELLSIEEDMSDIGVAQFKTFNKEAVDAIELHHMLMSAIMITRSALARKETRGAHLRLDFPEQDNENWKCNVIVKNIDGKMQICTEAVKS